MMLEQLKVKADYLAWKGNEFAQAESAGSFSAMESEEVRVQEWLYLLQRMRTRWRKALQPLVKLELPFPWAISSSPSFFSLEEEAWSKFALIMGFEMFLNRDSQMLVSTTTSCSRRFLIMLWYSSSASAYEIHSREVDVGQVLNQVFLILRMFLQDFVVRHQVELVVTNKLIKYAVANKRIWWNYSYRSWDFLSN